LNNSCLKTRPFSSTVSDWSTYISHHSRILSNSALTLKNKIYPEIFHCIQYTFYIQDIWATCACPEFAVLNILFAVTCSVVRDWGGTVSFKSTLRVYELNVVAEIHYSIGCLQNDGCLCFLSHIIICYTHIGTMAILDLKKTNI